MTCIVNFYTAISGQHIYKDLWQSLIEEKLVCKPDLMKEAIEYHKNTVDVSRVKEKETLVGHVPIKLSSFIKNLVNPSTENTLIG